LCTTSILTDDLTNASFLVNGITFSAGAVGFTLTGNPFQLSNTIADNATATETIDNLILLAANENFNPTLASGTLDINGVVAGAFRFQADSLGNVILGGSSASTYTGSTSSAGGGTLTENLTNIGAASSPVNLINSSSVLNLGNGNGPLVNTFVIEGAPTGASSQSFLGGSVAGTQGLVLAGGVGNIVLDPNGGTSTHLVLGGSSWARSGAAVLNIDLSSTAGGSMIVSATGTSIATNGVIGYATVKDSGGIGFASLSGTNIVRLTGQSALNAANTTSSTGTTNFIDSTAGTVTLAGSAAANSVTADSTAGPITIDLGGASDVLTLTALGLLTTGTNAVTIQDGQLGASGKEVILQTMGTGGVTVSANIGAGTGSLTKNGADTLTLSGFNTYTGVTSIQAGTVRAASASALGSNSAVTLLSSNGVVLDLTLSSVSIGSLAGGGAVLLGGNTLTLGGNNTSTSSTAVFSGAGAITKTGTGVQTLSGLSALTNADSININQGQLTNGGNIGSAVINLGNPAAGGTSAAAFASTVSLSVPINVQAGTSGTLAILAGNNQTISGSIVLGTGTTAQNVTLQNNNGGTANYGSAVSGYGNVYILNNATSSSLATSISSAASFNNAGFIANVSTGSDALNCSASIQGNVTEVIQNSSETMTLGGSNTYTGDTVVMTGSLVIANAYALQNSVLNFSSTNGVAMTAGANETMGGLAGNGTLTLVSGTNVTVNLTIGNSNPGNGSATNPNTLNPVFTGSLLESANATGASLTKVGTNTQTLAGLATYTGATTVSGGDLIVSGSLTGTYAVAVNGGTMEVDGLVNNATYTIVTGTLSGTGSLGSIAVNPSSLLAPGLSASGTAAGNLTANGYVGFSDTTSILSIRIGVTTHGSVVDGVTNGLDNDQLTIGNGGEIDLDENEGNGPTLSLSIGPAYSAAVADGLTFIIVNGGYVQGSDVGDSGVFSNGSTVTASNGDIYNILYGYDPVTGMVDGDGTDIALQLESAAVPEPGAWALMAGGAAMVALMRRRYITLP
jgi:autotransporter-associated beta strand protein